MSKKLLFLFFLGIFLISFTSAAFVDNSSLYQIAYDCGTLNTSNAMYVMNQSVTSTTTCFTITGQNITLDCGGNWINYSTGGDINTRGVFSSKFNVTIKNCNLLADNFTTTNTGRHGIYLSESLNSTIFNNFVNITSPDGVGILISAGSNFTNISNNIVVTNMSQSILIQSASIYNILKNNKATSNVAQSINLYSLANNNLLINNTGISLDSYGIYFYSSSNNTLINNTASSNSSYGLYFDSSHNNTLTNNTGRSNTNRGIYLYFSIDNNLTSNIGESNSSYGLLLNYSNNSVVMNNNGTSNSSYSIALYYSNNNTLTNTNGTSNNNIAIYFYSSSNNFLINNTFNGKLGGLRFDISRNNNLINNNITTVQSNAVYLISSSSNNTFIDNIAVTSLSSASVGMRISSSNNTLINNLGIGDYAGFQIDFSNGTTLINNTGLAKTNFGIYINSDNCTLINNTAISNVSLGIYINSDNNTLINNNATGNQSGMEFRWSSNNILINNTGIGNSRSGISINVSSNNNTLINNTGRSISHAGISIEFSWNNSLISNNVGGKYGYIIWASNYTNITDCFYTSGSTSDIYVYSQSGSIENIFTNCSYNLTKESVNGASNYLIRKWWYQAYVNYTNGTVVGNANISAYNSSSIFDFRAQTNSTGWINKTAITDYINRGGTRYYGSLFSLNVTDGMDNSSKSYNSTLKQNFLNDFFTLLYDVIAPRITIELPFPFNAPINVLNFAVVANVSDNYIQGNTSSWIDLDRSLVGYWSMDYYNSTHMFDNSSYGNNGTFQGNLSTNNISSGVRGDGLMFNGVGDYIRLSQNYVFTSNNTLSFWVKLGAQDYQAPFGGGLGLYAYIRFGQGAGTYLNTLFGETDTNSDNIYLDFTGDYNTLSLDTWYHFTIIEDSNLNWSLYINGIYQGSNITTNPNMTIARLGQGRANNDWLNGSLDEFIIFNRTLSYAEILALYNSQANRFNFTSTSVNQGRHNYTIHAIDTIGNYNKTGLISILYDYTPVSITFESPTPNNSSSIISPNNSVNIVANISDNLITENTSSWIDLDRSLVGYWSMDYYNATHVLDNSSYRNNGTMINLSSSNITTGVRGNALSFDGDDYLDVIDVSLGTEHTSLAWVKINNFNNPSISYMATLGGNSSENYFLTIGNASSSHSLIYSTGSTGGLAVVDWAGYSEGVWHMIASVRNNTLIDFYVDGSKIGSTQTITANNATTLGYIGRRNSAQFFNGSLDEVMIFNRSLSSTEILALYNSQANKFNVTFTNLFQGRHDYAVYSIDTGGNYNNSEERNFIFNTLLPTISFENPTPTSSSSISSNATIVANISDSSFENTSSWIDFDRSLVGYWSFDNYNATHILDNSSYGNNGTMINLSNDNITTGIRGNALMFDGIDDYVKLNNPLGLFDFGENDFTISWWMKAGDKGGAISKYSSSGGVGFILPSNNNTLFFRDGTDQIALTSSVTFLDNNLKNVVTKRNSTGFYVYVNGIQTGFNEGSLIDSLSLSLTHLWLGTATLSGGYWTGYNYSGLLDEVMIFNRSLSSTEINALYNSQANKFNATFTDLSQGRHDYAIHAIDSGGNYNTSGNRYFIFDNIGPTINFENPTPLNSSRTSFVNILASVSDSSNGNTSSWLDIDRSLLGYWSMDYYNGTHIFDNSSYGNNGTMINLSSSNITTGSRGNALSFDGDGDYVNISYSPYLDTSGDITLSAWIYTFNLTPSTEYIINHRASSGETKNKELRIKDSAILFGLAMSNGTWDTSTYLTGSTVLQERNWYHIVGVGKSNQYIKVYLNGVEDGSRNISWGFSNSNHLWNLGRRLDNYYYFNGSLDEVMIFNRSLSSNEIRALYNSQANKFNATFTGLSQGQHNYTLYAIDSAGNTNNSGERNFFFDNLAPTISIESPFPDNGPIKGTNVTIIANISDTSIENTSSWIDFDKSLVGYWGFNNQEVHGNDLILNGNFSQNSTNWTFGGQAGIVLNYNGTTLNISSNATAYGGVYQSNLTIGKRYRVELIYRTEASSTGGIGNSAGSNAYGLLPSSTTWISYSNDFTALTNSNLYFSKYTSAIGWIEFDNLVVYEIENTTDFSSYGNNGTLYGGIAHNFSGGRFGGAYNFDGVDDYISINSSTIAGDSNYSFSFWVKYKDIGLDQGLISKSSTALYIRYNASSAINKYTLQMYNGTSGGAVSLSSDIVNHFDNQWHHVVAVLDRTYGWTLYLDNVNAKSTPDVVTGNINNGNVFIGYREAAGTYLNGSIDEVIIFNRTLSQGEINTLYNSQANKFNSTFTNLSQGYHNYTLYGLDQAGNLKNSGTKYLLFDYNSPTITFENPTPLNNSYKKGNILFIANVSDNLNEKTSSWIDLDRSLVGYWSFDNYNATHILDNSSYGNNGSFNGGLNYTNLTDGARGNGLTFDGNGDYINLGSNTSLKPSSFTLSAWVKTNVSGINQGILSSTDSATGHRTGYSLTINTGNALTFRIGGDTTNFNESDIANFPIDNTWHHVVATYNGTMYLYLDSVLGNEYITFPIVHSSLPVYIGSYYASGPTSLTMNGSLDEVMIFNRSLSQQEINALYNSQANKFNATFTGLSEGRHDYTVYSIDSAGNTNDSGERNFIFDSISSTITFESPTPDNNSAVNDDIIITANISDNSNGNTSSWIDFDRDLLGYWSMDYYNGTHIFDNSSYGNNGTMINLSVNNITDGARGNGLILDGDGDYISLPNSNLYDIPANVNFTISLWVSRFGNSTGSPITGLFSHGATGSTSIGYNLRLLNNDSLYFQLGNGTNRIGMAYASVFSEANQWHHVIVTVDRRGNATFYVDGNLVGTPLNVSDYNVNLISNSNLLGSWTGSLYFFNGTLDEVMLFNRSLSSGEISALYNSQANKFNATFLDLDEGWHNYTLHTMDSAGNYNNSGIRNFEVSFAYPLASNITYYPNSTVDIDPGTNITFNASVMSERANVSAVILQYYDSVSGNWSNLTMSNILGNVYSANIVTISSEANYTFDIWTNDTLGNSGNSSVYNFSSVWDCNWNLSTSSLSDVSGFYEDKFIGNFTIFNNGDSNYTGGCRIRFTNNYISNSFSGTYYTSDFPSSTRISFNPSTVTLISGQNYTIELTGGFPDSDIVLQEHPIINITSNITDTVEGYNSRYLNISMIVVSGATLFEEIIEPSLSSLNMILTDSIFNWSSYVRNLGGDGSPNNTAYNVSFNWTLPSTLLDKISSGNITSFYENLSDFERRYNNLTLEFTKGNLESNSPPVNTPISVYIYSYGYENITGNLSLLSYSDNQTLLEDSFNITFLCNSEADGITISSCGSLDGDYVAPAPEIIYSSEGSGGGGGGAPTNMYEKSEATIELVRGEHEEFKLKIENKLPYPKENITITASGINSEYIELTPSRISKMNPNSSKEITIKISAPKYFNHGKYLLSFKIRGEIILNSTKNSFTEDKYLTLYIVEISRDSALDLIDSSDKMIAEMSDSGLKTDRLENLLEDMNNSLIDYDYGNTKSQYETLKNLYNSAIESREILNQLNEGIEKAKNKGIDVIETQKLVLIAEVAFERGDYALALERLKEAKLSYALEVKGEFNLLYEIKNNPLEYFGILIGLGFFGFGTSLVTRRALYKKKLKLLGEEEKLLLELMKMIQRDCFEKNKMSMEEYQEAMYQYENKLSEAIQDKIKFEAKLTNLMNIKGKRNILNQESKKLVDIMKELQSRYLNEAKVETRIYENMMKSYSSRLSEVEEKLVFLDAQESLKKRGSFWRIFK